MKIEIESGKYFEVNKIDEKKCAQDFEYYPVPPIKVEHLNIKMKDEYNGYIFIRLSNDDIIEYFCSERRNTGKGPDCDIYVKINDKRVVGSEFLEEYGGRRTWVEGILDFYVNYQKTK